MKLRIAFAIIGLAVGIIVAPMFIFEFKNINAGLWCLISGLIAGFVLIIHWKYKNDTLVSWFHMLQRIMLAGCILQLAGICAFTAYISLAIVLGQGLSEVHGENYWVASVWGGMTWKWGFQLFWFTRIYWKAYAALNKTKAFQSPNYATNGNAVISDDQNA